MESNKLTDRSDIRELVRERYGAAARLVLEARGRASCCSDQASGPGSCCEAAPAEDSITTDLYSEMEAKDVPETALLASLGCGNPTALAGLNTGETVLDLGSGGGIDVLLAAKRVGPEGFVYGLDMTDEMLAIAEKNRIEAGVENARFLKGHIEDIPLPDNTVDVIISNCVINLSADKDKVLREAFRVLKPGGRFTVSDIVWRRPVPEQVRHDADLWAGCVAGALLESEFRAKLTAAGFVNVSITPTRVYSPPTFDATAADTSPNVEGSDTTADAADALISAFIRAEKPA